MKVFNGRNANMFLIRCEGRDIKGSVKNVSMSSSYGGWVEVTMDGIVDDSAVVEPCDAQEGITKKRKETKKMSARRMDAYEYIVINRVEGTTSEKKGADNRDTIILGPKLVMARDAKEVERLAIREVPESFDIALVEVVVRPFAE